MLVLVWVAAPSMALAQSPAPSDRVAVATATGPREAEPVALTKGVANGLQGEGFGVAAGRRYRRQAESAGLKMTDLAAAEAARARFLVRLRVRSREGRFLVQVIVNDVGGAEVKRLGLRYQRAEQAERVGQALALRIAKAIEDYLDPVDSALAATEQSDAPNSMARDFEEAPAGSSTLLDPAPAATESEPGWRETTVQEAAAPLDERGRGEARAFRLTLAAGSELTTAYRVRVGGDDTSLGYDIGPRTRVDIAARYLWRPIRLGVRVEFGLTPSGFEVDEALPVQAQDLEGTFFSMGGHVFYALDVARFGQQSRLTLFPQVGVDYSSLRVDDDGPESIVLDHDAVDVVAGVRGRFLWTESLAVEADIRAGAIVSYREEPTNTGSPSPGFVLRFGGGVRYWVSPSFGVSVDLNYQYRQLSLSGQGTRNRFPNDPTIEDATIVSSHLRSVAGFIFAL